MIVFDKYEKRGAYHWRMYRRNDTYRDHVNKVRKWVRSGKTLDVGAGDGLIAFMLKVFGIDNNPTGVDLARERGADVELGSAYDLGKYKELDNVLMLDVLEHLEYPEKALKEVQAALSSDGLLYITTPLAEEGGIPNEYHYQEWTETGLVWLLEENEFKCVSIETEYERIYAIFKL